MWVTILSWSTGILLVSLVLLGLFSRRILKAMSRREETQALKLFRLQREYLEARFFDLASRAGKPKDLVWKDCEFHSDVTFARDARTGLLTAFVSVNISFEAVEGGDMEDVEAVGLLRDAAAIFHYQKGNWGTGGRALFNMNPADALVRLEGQYLPLEIEAGPKTTTGPHNPVGNRTSTSM